MIFQFPKCGSCGFDGSHIFGCASDCYHTSTVHTIFVLSGPFFSDPYWDNLHLQATLFDSGRENATRPLQLDVIKGFGDIFFCYPCRASNSLVCQSIHFNIFDKHVFRCLITRIQSISPKNKFIFINYMVLFNHRLPGQNEICIQIT